MTKQTRLSADNLARRGISEEIARFFHITETRYHRRVGWKYPLHDLEGQPVAHRFKDYDSSAKPKYVWLDGGDLGKTIYGVPALKAIQADKTQFHVYLVNGEPSVWAMKMAGRNAICFSTGESNIPDNFLDILTAHGITKVTVFPDNDATGMKAARRLNLLFENVDITLEIFSVADAWEELIDQTCPKGADIADLMRVYAHNIVAEQYIDEDIGDIVIGTASRYPLKLVDPESPPKQKRNQNGSYPSSSFNDEYNPKLVDAILSRLYAQGGRMRGNNQLEVLSPAPHRKDSPGEHAIYYFNSHGVYDHAHGKFFKLIDLAEHFGIDMDALGGLYEKSDYHRQTTPDRRHGPPIEPTRQPEPEEIYSPKGDPESVIKDKDLETLAEIALVHDKERWVAQQQAEWEALEYDEKLIQWGYTQCSLKRVDKRIEQQFLDLQSLALGEGVHVIRSAMGTGKTEIAKQIVRKYQRVLVLTHRVSLARNLAHRLKMPLYKDYPTPEELKEEDRMIICVNSLDKLTEGDGFEQFDALIIDEAEQVIEHIGGNTFEGAHALNTFALIEHLMKQAKIVLLMDANMPQSIVEWAEKIRDDVNVIENIWQPLLAGDWVFYQKRDAIIEKMLTAVREGERIAIATGKTESRRLEKMFRSAGFDDILVINQDTVADASNTRVQSFLRDPDNNMAQIIIYSPTIGSGVDIQAPIDAMYLIDTMSQVGLAATDLVQMMGRFRNCRQRLSHVRSQFFGKRETNHELVHKARMRSCSRTAVVAGYNELNAKVYSPIQEDFEWLQSRLDAERNRSMNQTPIHLYSIAKNTNWNIIVNKETSDISELIKQIRTEDKLEQKEGVLNAKAITKEEFRYHQMRKTVTQELIWGHEKFVIASYLGKTEEENHFAITEEEYDLFSSPTTRKKLDLYCSLNHDPLSLIFSDLRERDELISKRSHHYGTALVLSSLLHTLFGEDQSRVYTTEDLEYVFTKWKNDTPDAKIFLPKRAFRQTSIYKQVSYLLGLIGFKMHRKQRKYTQGNKRCTTYDYRLNLDWLQKWEKWRQVRAPIYLLRDLREPAYKTGCLMPRPQGFNLHVRGNTHTLVPNGEPTTILPPGTPLPTITNTYLSSLESRAQQSMFASDAQPPVSAPDAACPEEAHEYIDQDDEMGTNSSTYEELLRWVGGEDPPDDDDS